MATYIVTKFHKDCFTITDARVQDKITQFHKIKPKAIKFHKSLYQITTHVRSYDFQNY